jgi:hypothetical protein
MIGRGVLSAIALAGLLLCASGCAAVPTGPVVEVPRAAVYTPQTRAAAVFLAQAWAAQEPSRRGWSTAGDTGSMMPAIRGGDLLLLQRPVPRMSMPAGTIVVWFRGDWFTNRPGTRIGNPAHRVRAERGGAIFIQGDACSRPDGWFAKGTVEWIVAGIVRMPRS